VPGGQGRRGTRRIRQIEDAPGIREQGACNRLATQQMTPAAAFPRDAAGGSVSEKPKPMQILHGLGEGLVAGQAFPPCTFSFSSGSSEGLRGEETLVQCHSRTGWL
jgi:hypothetical protein